MKTYEKNYADSDFVVHRLKVLTEIEGGGLSEIQTTVDALKRQANAINEQQEKYWTALSSDSVISPSEKQSLKRELENIRRSYSAVTTQASNFGYSNPILTDYTNTYQALRDYLYDTLKIFDYMEKETAIPDRDYFNQLFSNYFFLENFVLLAITKGVLDTVNIRVLANLNEEGTEGETGLYRGGLYQYTNGRWKSVSTGNYKGALAQLPAEEEDAFFLCSDSFYSMQGLIVNGEQLLVNGEPLEIKRYFQKGYIYYCKGNDWICEFDKSNYLYVAAFADVLNVTGELPQIFQDALDNMQAQIDGKIDHVPEYLGVSAVLPSPAYEGDFFLYSGGTTGGYTFATVYRRNNNTWQGLDSDNPAYSYYYMTALQDILSITQTSQGYFNSVFAQSFFANTGTLETLAVTQIKLKAGGCIQSEKTLYAQESAGLRIDADGDIDANGNSHFGGKVAIGVSLVGNPDFNNFDVVIGGSAKIGGDNTTISGKCNVDRLHFSRSYTEQESANFNNGDVWLLS